MGPWKVRLAFKIYLICAIWSQCLRTPQCGLQPGMAPWLRASKVQRMETKCGKVQVCCFGPSPALSKPYDSLWSLCPNASPVWLVVGSLLKAIMEKQGRMSPYHLKAIPLQAGSENGWIPCSWPYGRDARYEVAVLVLSTWVALQLCLGCCLGQQLLGETYESVWSQFGNDPPIRLT